jgi:hypothetical protein
MKRLLLATLVGAGAMSAPAEPDLSVVPRPAHFRVDDAPGFTLQPGTRIQFGEDDAVARAVAEQLAATLRRLSGLPLPVSVRSEDDETMDFILLDVDPEAADTGPEGSEMSCDENMIALVSSTSNGLAYAAGTLVQLFTAGPTNQARVAPACEVRDLPRFRWRGVHLDRTPTPEEAGPLLGLMSRLKLNVLAYPAAAAAVTNTTALDGLAAAQGVRLFPYPEPAPARDGGSVLFGSPEPPRSAVRYSGTEPARTLFPLRSVPLTNAAAWTAAARVPGTPDAAAAAQLAQAGLDVIVSDDRPETVRPGIRPRVLGALIPWKTGAPPAEADLSRWCQQADLLWRQADAPAARHTDAFAARLPLVLGWK